MTGPFVSVSYGGDAGPSFYRLHGGELVETVDVLADGSPDWAGASVVEVGRGNDAALSAATLALVRLLGR